MNDQLKEVRAALAATRDELAKLHGMGLEDRYLAGAVQNLTHALDVLTGGVERLDRAVKGLLTATEGNLKLVTLLKEHLMGR